MMTTLQSMTWLWLATFLAGVWLVAPPQNAAAEGHLFTSLAPLPSPEIVAAAEAFNGEFHVKNILKPSTSKRDHPEYASRGMGTRTFIDFDFGRPVRIAAFKHVQRRTLDTVAESKLVFSDTDDFKRPLATMNVEHVDEVGATTFAAFSSVTARYLRWQVAVLRPGRSPNVGGQSIEFFSAGEPESSPQGIKIETRTVPMVEHRNGVLVQRLELMVNYPYAEPLNAFVRLQGQESRPLDLKFGRQTLEYTVVAPEAEQALDVAILAGDRTIVSRTVTLKPTRKLTLFILPHSHTDIGYTALQTDIEEKQVNNLLEGIACARRTANYPAGARFVWNVEVLWAADLFLKRLPLEQRQELFDAVKRGQVALNGMYLNELTGLCRPEELVRLFRYATQIGEQTEVPVDSAMISDVPGYTWGTATAMAQAGIRYFSAGINPNEASRIGDSMARWENKPFWWIGPDGQSQVLVWIPFEGYALSHGYEGVMSSQVVERFLNVLDTVNYPYDIAYIRWTGNTDNAAPTPAICEFVKEWNTAHAWPRLVISSTSEAFRALENRYGSVLPRVRGDWTPYWEDGAGSSAAETAMNRASSERLSQAEALWAMLQPSSYPQKRFEEAWNNVLLYSEHTWGAWCSVTEPANPFTLDQWTIKQSYATAANLQSRQLLTEAAQRGGLRARGHRGATDQSARTPQFDVFNTTSWPRSELILVPREITEGSIFVTDDGRSFVTDDQGQATPAQTLRSRELAVWVRELPPFSGRRYTVGSGKPPSIGQAKADAMAGTLENGCLRLRVDLETGGITELYARGLGTNLVDTASGYDLNDYLYLVGDELAGLQRNGRVKISMRDKGPLVASLLVESDAPGCHKLAREIRLAADADYVELYDLVDKERPGVANYRAKVGKESVNFAFPFNVPGGDLRFDAPFAVIRPEQDQMPAACKNWLSVGRWAEVANQDYGVTWVTLDAPLIQAGGITATLLNSTSTLDSWRKRIEPTQRIFSWVMNNHEETNYRGYQEGPVPFRFVLRPHQGPPDDVKAARFATAFSQPLVVVPSRGPSPSADSRLRIQPEDVMASALKPSDDGKAIIVRLFGAGGKAEKARLDWSEPRPQSLWLSDTSEQPLQRVVGEVPVPAWGVVTLRAEFAGPAPGRTHDELP